MTLLDDKHFHFHFEMPEHSDSVNRKLDLILTHLPGIETRLGALERQGVKTMADVASVKQLVVDLGAETDTLSTKVDGQVALIAALKKQIAEGSPVTQADLDAIADGLTPISARLKALGSDPTDPIPTPVPDEPPLGARKR